MQTQALIFDMDGTMVDSIPWHAKSWTVFAERHGLEITLPDLMRRTNGRNGAECMVELFQHDMPAEEAWRLIGEKEEIYRELFSPQFTEVAGFKQFARQAQQSGLRVGVGTAGDRHNIQFVFSHLAMEHRPSVVVGGDEGLPGKPEPAIFLEVARRLDAAPEHCIVFEDAPFGIEAARRAGMRAVAVCTTHTSDELAGPHVVASVRNFRELMDTQFLEKLHVA